MQVSLDTPVEIRAGKFRELLDEEKAASYRALQESDEEFPEALAPPRPAGPGLVEGGRSLLALARGRDRREGVRLDVELLGGICRVIPSPGTSLIKPDFNSADPFPASSHRDYLGALVALLREAGCPQLDFGGMGGGFSPFRRRRTSSAGG